MKWLDACPATDIPTTSGKLIRAGDLEIALFQVDGQLMAIDNECPHYGASLCHGYLSKTTITCPWHGWQFRLESGQCLSAPGFDIASYPVRVVGDTVQIGVKDEEPVEAPAAAATGAALA